MGHVDDDLLSHMTDHMHTMRTPLDNLHFYHLSLIIDHLHFHCSVVPSIPMNFSCETNQHLHLSPTGKINNNTAYSSPTPIAD